MNCGLRCPRLRTILNVQIKSETLNSNAVTNLVGCDGLHDYVSHSQNIATRKKTLYRFDPLCCFVVCIEEPLTDIGLEESSEIEIHDVAITIRLTNDYELICAPRTRNRMLRASRAKSLYDDRERIYLEWEHPVWDRSLTIRIIASAMLRDHE